MLLHPRKLSLAGWLASAAGLAAGYALAGSTGMLPLALLPLLAGACDRRWPALGLSWLALVGAVILAAAGIFLAAPALWMTLAAAAALAAWDLAVFAASVESTQRTLSSPERAAHPARFQGEQPGTRVDQRHVQALGLALGGGLLAALVGQQISLSIPFIGMLLGVVLLVACLDRVWRRLNR